MDWIDNPTDVLQEREAVGAETDIRHDFNERYKILRTLGRGGMAAVHLALDRRLNQHVALKIFTGGGDELTFKRILREARAGRGLNHPNVVRVHDLLETPEGPAIVMEYVEGKTLREVMKEKNSLPVQEALAVFDQILQGLESLHQAGIIHRDIKPENVFVMPDGKVKIGDFSICAPLTGTRLTADAHALGTPQYMAPEQIQGKDPAFTTDIYAAGIVLYEMLAGRRPFDGENPSQVMHKQIHATPSLKDLDGGRAPRWLKAFIARCLAKSPRERYGSVAEARGAIVRQSAGLAWRRVMKRMATAAIILCLAGVGWALYKSVLHKRVNSYRVNGKEVDACDDRGRVLWTKSWPAAVTHSGEMDLNGNGIPDLVGFAAGGGGASDSVRTFFLQDSGDSWEFADFILKDLEFQGESGGFRAYFWPGDLDGDGWLEPAEAVQGYWAPAFLEIYSARERRRIAEVRHPGHISWVKYADVNGDGIKDIIGLAINNPLGHTASLFALDGRSLLNENNLVYPIQIVCPGWRTPKERNDNGASLLFYALLPMDGGTVHLADPQTVRVEKRGWSIPMAGETIKGDWAGNIEGGPTSGMGPDGRREMQDYFLRIQGMRAAALNGDAALARAEDWVLPSRFMGSGIWEEAFLLNKGRALMQCLRPAEGLAALRELSARYPSFQEGCEAYGIALFLTGGSLEEASKAVVKGALESAQSPMTAFYSRLMMRILSGKADLRELQNLTPVDGNVERLEKARLWMAFGQWVGAGDIAATMDQGTFYREALPVCRAVLKAHDGTLSATDLDAADAAARNCIELRDMAGLARAIAAKRQPHSGDSEWLTRFLSDLKRRSAWDLDARLTLAIYSSGK